MINNKIIYNESDSNIHYFNKDTGFTVLANRVKTYLGNYCYEITIGNMKDNSITNRKTAYSFKEAKQIVKDVIGGLNENTA